MTSPTHVGAIGQTPGASAGLALDFEIARGGTLWTVFNCRTGETVAEGEGSSREASFLRAVGTIARAIPTRLFVVRNRTGYVVWHPEAGAWFPMVLTAAATDTDAHDMAAGFAWATGRNVEVLDIARH